MRNRLKEVEFDDSWITDKHITSVNLTIRSLNFLRKLRDENYIKSVSEGVRDMIQFALPYFLKLVHRIDDFMENKLDDIIFEKPKKLSIADLKKLYPKIIDYKDINEE